jgi:hypothetical protein
LAISTASFRRELSRCNNLFRGVKECLPLSEIRRVYESERERESVCERERECAWESSKKAGDSLRGDET